MYDVCIGGMCNVFFLFFLFFFFFLLRRRRDTSRVIKSGKYLTGKYYLWAVIRIKSRVESRV